MANAFTIYWGAYGWQGYGPGDPLRGAGGSGFLGKVSPGDRVYVTNIAGGALRIAHVSGPYLEQASLDAIMTSLVVRIRQSDSGAESVIEVGGIKLK